MAAVTRDITVREAAGYLPGMSCETLKKWLRDAYLMKARECPFAHAVLSDSGQWNYYVYRVRLFAYINANDLNAPPPS